TVHEVVNGMIVDDRPAAPELVLGVVAGGSGCDFIRTFGLPSGAAEAAHRLAGDAVRPLDIGKVSFAGAGGQPTTRYFPNIAEAGLGAACLTRAASLPRALGPSVYFFAFW